jgi:hypothetical protein
MAGVIDHLSGFHFKKSYFFPAQIGVGCQTQIDEEDRKDDDADIYFWRPPVRDDLSVPRSHGNVLLTI